MKGKEYQEKFTKDFSKLIGTCFIGESQKKIEE